MQGKHPDALKPDHSVFATIPLVRGEFLERVNTGKIKLHRASVKQINANSIDLTNGTSIDADAIVACTGFQTKFPYLPNDVLGEGSDSTKDWQTFNLYQLVKPVHYPNIFFIGFAEAAGPAAPLYEAQARWSVNLLANNISLPSHEQQLAAIKRLQMWQQKESVPSERHNMYVLYLEYIDALLKPLGAAPSMSKLLKLLLTSGHPVSSLRTMSAVYLKVAASGQWRLFGNGSKPDWAMETTLRVTGHKKEMTEKEQVLLEKLRPGATTMGTNGALETDHKRSAAV